MNNRVLIRISLRLVALLGWSGIIILFLYLPSFISYTKNKKSINILAFPQIIDKEFLTDFEKQHNIQININYFESSEDLLTKLRTTPDHDYDLFMVADSFIPILIREELIKPLERTQLLFWNNLEPAFLNHTFDPDNIYSIPCFWSVYGLAINTQYKELKGVEVDWALIFNRPPFDLQIGLIEDIRELFLIAGYHFFNKTADFTKEQIKYIKKRLIEQKKWVAVYTDMRTEFLLASQTVPIVLTSSSDVLKIVKRFSHLTFVVPQKSFLKIDSYVIAASTQKDNEIYALLNYVYSPTIMHKYAQKFEFLTPLSSVVQEISTSGLQLPSLSTIQKLPLFGELLPAALLEKIWVALKAA